MQQSPRSLEQLGNHWDSLTGIDWDWDALGLEIWAALTGTHWNSLTHTPKHGEWRQGASTLEGLEEAVGRSVSHWRRRGVSVGR